MQKVLSTHHMNHNTADPQATIACKQQTQTLQNQEGSGWEFPFSFPLFPPPRPSRASAARYSAPPQQCWHALQG
eukprot:365630-Chlamydomonas_euryale.AAC.15